MGTSFALWCTYGLLVILLVCILYMCLFPAQKESVRLSDLENSGLARMSHILIVDNTDVSHPAGGAKQGLSMGGDAHRFSINPKKKLTGPLAPISEVKLCQHGGSQKMAELKGARRMAKMYLQRRQSSMAKYKNVAGSNIARWSDESAQPDPTAELKAFNEEIFPDATADAFNAEIFPDGLVPTGGELEDGLNIV